MPIVFQCIVNAVKMDDIFPYWLSYFGHKMLNG